MPFKVTRNITTPEEMLYFLFWCPMLRYLFLTFGWFQENRALFHFHNAKYIRIGISKQEYR